MALHIKKSANNRKSKPSTAHIQPPTGSSSSPDHLARTITPIPPPPPLRDDDVKQADKRREDHAARYGQDCQNPDLYYQHPPARSRRPYNLYNTKKAGVTYRGAPVIGAQDGKLIMHLLRSEHTFVIMTLLCMYHYRMHNVHGKDAMSIHEIRALFQISLCDFPFSLHELYKRYAMRKGRLHGRELKDLDFQSLSNETINSFRNWLESISYWKSAGPAFMLWRLGVDDDGKPWLKLNPSELTLNLIQLINVLHDNLYQWKCCLWGVDWIESTLEAAPYVIG